MLEGTPDVDLDSVGSTQVGAMVVEVIDPVEDYLNVRLNGTKSKCADAYNVDIYIYLFINVPIQHPYATSHRS